MDGFRAYGLRLDQGHLPSCFVGQGRGIGKPATAGFYNHGAGTAEILREPTCWTQPRPTTRVSNTERSARLARGCRRARHRQGRCAPLRAAPRWPAAILDRGCARRPKNVRPGRGNGLQTNKETPPKLADFCAAIWLVFPPPLTSWPKVCQDCCATRRGVRGFRRWGLRWELEW